jgi:hypothetical protein
VEVVVNMFVGRGWGIQKSSWVVWGIQKSSCMGSLQTSHDRDDASQK